LTKGVRPRHAPLVLTWTRGGTRLSASIALATMATACGAIPQEVPVGGVRAPITAENLAHARAEMAGGLLEPGWLPDGFRLVHADFIGRHAESVDLTYESETNYVHIWQTVVTPQVLAASDPVPMGEPIPGSEWNANRLHPAQTGQAEVVIEYSTRWPDGRTVTADSDLPDDVMRRILDSVLLRSAGDAE
jgi:hypothetical protein